MFAQRTWAKEDGRSPTIAFTFPTNNSASSYHEGFLLRHRHNVWLRGPGIYSSLRHTLQVTPPDLQPHQARLHPRPQTHADCSS